MSEYVQENVVVLAAKALKSGRSEDIAAAIDKATHSAKVASGVVTQLALSHPTRVAEYCAKVTELPCVYSADASRNKLNQSIADSLGLGSKAHFNYKGDRRGGLLTKLAVERIIDIIGEIKETFSAVPDKELKESGALGDVIIRMKNLPELSSDSLPEWKSSIADYALYWFHATDEEKSSRFSMAFPTIDLIDESYSYAEQRLESRRAEKIRVLQRKFPHCLELDQLWKQGVPDPRILDYAFDLSRYQADLAKIESMQMDEDCWRYAFERIIGERLGRLLRPHGN